MAIAMTKPNQVILRPLQLVCRRNLGTLWSCGLQKCCKHSLMDDSVGVWKNRTLECGQLHQLGTKNSKIEAYGAILIQNTTGALKLSHVMLRKAHRGHVARCRTTTLWSCHTVTHCFCSLKFVELCCGLQIFALAREPQIQ